MPITFERLERWPYEQTSDRKSRYTFKASYQTIRTDLEREIELLDGYNVLLEADMRPHMISRSGWPLADARTGICPGVRLSFTIDSRKGPVKQVHECDAYEIWQHNLRGISLTLEALRAIARHGAVRKAQQYAGFRTALPSGNDTATNAAETVRTLAAMAGYETTGAAIRADRQIMRAAYRAAAGRLHPDNQQTGDAGHFAQLQDAVQVLETAFGA